MSSVLDQSFFLCLVAPSWAPCHPSPRLGSASLPPGLSVQGDMHTNQPPVLMPPSCYCRHLTWRLSELGIIPSPNPYTPLHQSFNFIQVLPSPHFEIIFGFDPFDLLWLALFLNLFMGPILSFPFSLQTVSVHVPSHLDDSDHLWLPDRLHCVGSLAHQCTHIYTILQ